MSVRFSHDYCVVFVFQKLKSSTGRLFREDAIIRNLIDAINITLSLKVSYKVTILYSLQGALYKVHQNHDRSISGAKRKKTFEITFPLSPVDTIGIPFNDND